MIYRRRMNRQWTRTSPLPTHYTPPTLGIIDGLGWHYPRQPPHASSIRTTIEWPFTRYENREHIIRHTRGYVDPDLGYLYFHLMCFNVQQQIDVSSSVEQLLRHEQQWAFGGLGSQDCRANNWRNPHCASLVDCYPFPKVWDTQQSTNINTSIFIWVTKAVIRLIDLVTQ